MPVNEQVTDSVTQTNTKLLGDGPSIAANTLYQAQAQAVTLAMQNAVANQQAMQSIQQAAVTVAVNKLLNMDPSEALSVLKANSGNDLAQQIAALMAAIGGNQQVAKGAQTTPPVTP